jgi:hypothetical protein
MTATIVNQGRGSLAIRIDGVASTASGGQGAILNPEGVNLLITKATEVFHVAAGAGNTLSVGVAADAETPGTDILNELEQNKTAGQVWNGFERENAAVTQVSAPAVWESDEYVTFTASATLAGLDATLFLEYIRIDEPDVDSQ